MTARPRNIRPRNARRLLTVAQARSRYKPGRRLVRQLIVLAAIVAAVVAAERQGLGLHHEGDMQRYHHGSFLVVRVIDGDTLAIDSPDGEKLVTRVRLWGINAPELAKPWQPIDASEPGAVASREVLRFWAEGRVVRLQLLPDRMRGDFGRVLGYVYGPGGICLNEQLIRSGWAPAYGRWWHPQKEVYRLLNESAKRQKRGLWAEESR